MAFRYHDDDQSNGQLFHTSLQLGIQKASNFYKKTDESPALLPTSPLLSSIRCTNGGKQAVSGLWGKEYKSFSLRISLCQYLNASKAPKTSDRHVTVAQESTNTSPLPQCQRITPYSNLLLVHCPAAGALPGGCQLQSNSVVEDITFRRFRKWQLIWYHDAENI